MFLFVPSSMYSLSLYLSIFFRSPTRLKLQYIYTLEKCEPKIKTSPNKWDICYVEHIYFQGHIESIQYTVF